MQRFSQPDRQLWPIKYEVRRRQRGRNTPFGEVSSPLNRTRRSKSRFHLNLHTFNLAGCQHALVRSGPERFSMIHSTRFRWLSSIAVTLVTLASTSGCKQMSAWTNTAPMPSSSNADPFAYPPTSDTYFHQPEGAPLSPVPELPAPGPELPAPGHSLPMDPPPPPVPEANPPVSQRSVTARLKQWMTPRPVSFFKKRETPLSSTDSSNLGSNAAVETSERRSGFAVEEDHPSAKIQRASSRLANQSTSPAASEFPASPPPAPRSGPKIIVTPGYGSTSFPAKPSTDESFDDGYTGPVITPGAQYTIGRETPIEAWPYNRRTASNPASVPLRKQPTQALTDSFVPAETAPQSTQPAPPAASSASLPLLLPPGP